MSAALYPRDRSIPGVDQTLLRRTTLHELEREHAERQRTGERRFTLSSKDPNVTFDTRFPLFGPSGEELGYVDQYWEIKFMMACCERWGTAELPHPTQPLPGGTEDSAARDSWGPLSTISSARPSYFLGLQERRDDESLAVSAVSQDSLYRDSHCYNPAVLSDVLTASRSTAGNIRRPLQNLAAPSVAQSAVLPLGSTTRLTNPASGNVLGELPSHMNETRLSSAAVDRQLRFTTGVRQSVAARPSVTLPMFQYPQPVELALLARSVDGGFHSVDATSIANEVEHNLNSQFASLVVDCTDQKTPPLICNTQVVIADRQFFITSALGNGAFAATATEEGVFVVLYKWLSHGAVLGTWESTRAILGHRILAPSRDVYGFAFADGGITAIVTDCRAIPLGDALGHPSTRLVATKLLLQALTTLLSRRVIHGSFTPQNLFICEDGTFFATHWEGAVDFTMFADSLAGCTTLLAFDLKGERHLRGFDADLITCSAWITTIPRPSLAAWAVVMEQLSNRPTRWADYLMSLRSVVGTLTGADVSTLSELFIMCGTE